MLSVSVSQAISQELSWAEVSLLMLKPQAENFSNTEFYLVLKVESELQWFFSYSSLSFELSPHAWLQSGVFFHALVPPAG